MVRSRNKTPTSKALGIKLDKRWMASKRKQASHPLPLLPYTTYKDFTYPQWWNTKARTRIKVRDSYACQLCQVPGTNKTLVIHHINYDKRDCQDPNVITLCKPCHDKTRYNRLYWYAYFWKQRLP